MSWSNLPKPSHKSHRLSFRTCHLNKSRDRKGRRCHGLSSKRLEVFLLLHEIEMALQKDKHLSNTHHTRCSIHAWKHGRFEYMEWGSEAGITKMHRGNMTAMYIKKAYERARAHTSESGAITRHRNWFRNREGTQTLIVTRWAWDKVRPKCVDLEISDI